MPGKVNPVIPEMMNQIGFQVIGNDLVVTLAASAGQLQLNAMEPVIVLNILQSMRLSGGEASRRDAAVRHQRPRDRIGLIEKRGFSAHRSSIEGSEDETEIRAADICGREDDQGHPPRDAQAPFF